MAFAWDHEDQGLDYCLPDKPKDPVWHPTYLGYLGKSQWDSQRPVVVLAEYGHAYRPLVWREEWKNFNIILKGYFQSERYFVHHRQRLLNTLRFPWMLLKDTVSVHVRRTDYLTIQRRGLLKHPLVTRDWYEAAMGQFPGKKFLFFSDDLSWCRQQWGSRSDCSFSVYSDGGGGNPPVFPLDPRPELQDLVLGSWCEHHICSASTFGWWQAWLGRHPAQRVLIPKLWFSPGWNGLETQDIVPKHWERV
jgi:hypothetical protein